MKLKKKKKNRREKKDQLSKGEKRGGKVGQLQIGEERMVGSAAQIEWAAAAWADSNTIKPSSSSMYSSHFVLVVIDGSFFFFD